MVIKEEEHQDVSKNNFNLINFSKKYKQIGNEILNFFKKRVKDKYDYLKRVKNNNSRLTYLKKFKSVKKHDKMRLKKIKRTEPFPLFKPRTLKKKKQKKLFNQVKEPNLNFNKILYVHQIYQKLNKKYYYYNNKLQTLKKKSKYFFNLKLHLWTTLSVINYSNKINYFKSTLPSLNLDQQFKFLYSIQNNYLLKNKIKLKNKIFYTIFKNYNNIISRNVYKVQSYNKFIKFYYAHFLDNFFYINLDLKHMVMNTYYNKIFFINYDINYYNTFYHILKFKCLNNFLLKLNYKNYYNTLYDHRKNFNTKFSIYNIVFTKPHKILLNLKKNINIIDKKSRYITIKLMRAKKWTRHAIAKINTKVLKKLVLNNSRLNMYVNDKTKVKKKTFKVNYFLSSTYFKEENKPIKIKKYNFYFLNFLKKFSILQRRILKKNYQYNYYISKKYRFLVNFLSYYFKQLFLSLKFIFNSNIKNIYLYLLKLKFLLFYIYYNIFTRYINPKCSKKQKKIINNNKLFNFNMLLYYKKALKVWFSKKKKEWRIKKQKKIENNNYKFNYYARPINVFKYNPLLNPRHNLWAKRKTQKYKKIFNIIKYKINGYLRWFKWETKRKLHFKYRLMLLKKKRNRFNKQFGYFKPKLNLKTILLKKIKKLLKKSAKILKKNKKIKNKHIKKFLKKLKKKYFFKAKPFTTSLKQLNIFKVRHKTKMKKLKRKFILRKKKIFFKRFISQQVIYKKQQLKLQKLWIKKLKKFYMKKPKYKRNRSFKKNYKNYKYKTIIK